MLDINSFSKKKNVGYKLHVWYKMPMPMVYSNYPSSHFSSFRNVYMSNRICLEWREREREREREIPPIILPLSLLVLQKWKSCKDRNHMQRVCLKMREGKDKMAWRFGIYSKPPLYPFLKSYTLLKDCNNRNKPFVRIMSIY